MEKLETYDIVFYDKAEDDFNVQFTKTCTKSEIDSIIEKLNRENSIDGNYFAELA